jgi:hypothetical protein
MTSSYTTTVSLPACCSLDCLRVMHGYDPHRTVCRCGHGPLSRCGYCKMAKAARNVVNGMCGSCAAFIYPLNGVESLSEWARLQRMDLLGSYR